MENVQGGTTGSHPKPGAEMPPALNGHPIVDGQPVLDGQPVHDGPPTVISKRVPLSVPPRSETAGPSGSEAAPPARLGHFQLTGFIGGGGMGRVFLAYDTALARSVAVKVLSREQAADEGLVARFRNEAQSAARLNHENIVQVYHVG
jgi:serine/threonine protein kinase